MKNEFINILINGLIYMPKDQRDDIISQYEEHFNVETSNGKSETEIIQELGDPYEIISKYSEGSSNYKNTEEINTNANTESFTKKIEPNIYTNDSRYETSANYNGTKKKERSIFTIIFLLILCLILSPGIFGVVVSIVAALFSGIIFSLALTFSSVLIFFAKVLNTGHLKDMLGGVIDQIPTASTVFFLIGNIALTILSFIVVIQIIKFLWILIKKFFRFIKNIFN